MAMKKKINNKVAKVGVGLGIAAAIGAAAYFFGTDSGKKTKKKAVAWAEKAKKEVLAEMKKAKSISKTHYHAVVEKVMKKYSKLDKEAAILIVKELKGHWDNISKEMKAIEKTATTAPKKVVKKKKKMA